MTQTAAPTTSLTLRPMAAADVPRVGQIDMRAFGEGGWPATAFADELHNNRLARYFVLDPGEGRPLQGYLGCWALADALHIVTVAVDPTYQRRGLGEILVQQALDLAHKLGVDEVTLECRESNEPALKLYRKYQFKQAGRRRRYYQDNKEDALILTASDVRDPSYRATVERLRGEHRRRYGLAVRVRTS